MATFLYSGPTINADGSALRADTQWSVDFTTFGPTIVVTMSYEGKIDAAVVPGGLSLWSSAISLDESGTGDLLALKELPTAGTGGIFLPYSVSTMMPNPGGTKFVVLTSFGGTLGYPAFTSVTMTYQNVVITISSPEWTRGSATGGRVGSDLLAVVGGIKP